MSELSELSMFQLKTKQQNLMEELDKIQAKWKWYIEEANELHERMDELEEEGENLIKEIERRK